MISTKNIGGRKMPKIFSDLGYKTYASIADDCISKGYCEKSKRTSLRATMGRIFSGRTKMSERIKDYLIKLTNNNPEVVKICEVFTDISKESFATKKIELSIIELINEYSDKLRIMIENESELSEKVIISEKFKKFVDNM